ncbi:MAG TPA: CGNR zinc finger domain-containing protein [Negativicutes bacterium]|nr:CGNR zinc finger domain-containing protein [Negativicutes bacterium]
MDHLCLDYVNSSWYITHKLFYDPLQNSEWMAKLTKKWLCASLPAPSEAELKELFDVRISLSGILDKATWGKAPDEEDIKLLNGYMSKVSYHMQLQYGTEGLRLLEISANPDWTWFMAEAAASLARLLASEAAGKLKKCQNPECGWFFIDESKSGNRKWCDDTCATLMKVRRFREKHR